LSREKSFILIVFVQKKDSSGENQINQKKRFKNEENKNKPEK
jgi:hypothetical protein